MNEGNVPEGDRIYDLYTGVYEPQIIRIALALDVFSPLSTGSLTAKQVAQACKCEVTGIRHLLNYLASLSLMVKHAEEYSLSPEAATFLVRGEKAYTGDLIMNFSGPLPWESVQETIRSGQPRNIDLEIHFAQDAWIESYRAARIPSSLEMWAKAGMIPDRFTRLRILDLACGCAIKSMVLVRNSPNVELTCLDSPMVLEVARDLAERWGVTSQVSFMSANLLTADLGDALYDACLLGQVTHYLTQQQNNELYRRIHRALIPGGMLLLDVPMATAQPDEGSSFLSLILWANSGGRAYSFEEYQQWLIASGFKDVRKLSERLLSAGR
jgi:ubiquinone/menaquinone biosynthesis C-methylase UbiE